LSIVAGIGGMTIGVIIAHYAGYSADAVTEYFNWIPRGWLPQTIGQLIAFGASQALLLGMVLIVWNQKELTWAKATYFAFLTWIEMSILLGIVPSEWLNLSQGPLEWTGQREFIQFPPILFLNNEIGLSLAALKDLIQMGISTNFLIAGLVVAYYIQDINDKIESTKTRISDYGKEVVKVTQDA
tara:strand:- start:169 stop:720 length:552 start_codon:yes stop_codon:yes gene_type:complete